MHEKWNPMEEFIRVDQTSLAEWYSLNMWTIKYDVTQGKTFVVGFAKTKLWGGLHYNA